MENKRRKIMLSGVSGLLFIVLIILVKTVNVDDIGPNGTKIGLSGINDGFHRLTGEITILYKITEVFGILALLVAGCFACLGLYQLIKRKSLKKVDGEIYALAVLYVITIGLYALFEKVIVNYRPVIMSGETEPEASFPSSHTMLICVIMGSTCMVLEKYIADEKIRKILAICCKAVLVATVLGRLFCGVHWFTDIFGGVLISVCLLSLFSTFIELMERK